MNLGNNSSRLSQNLRILPKFFDLKQHSIIAHHENLVSLLRSCKQTTDISQLHGFMVKIGLDQNPFNLSKLLASSIPNVQYAASIFKHIENPNLFMFNTMLRCYSIGDNPQRAFSVFSNLRAQSFELDQFSFITFLKVCTRVMDIMTGQVIHGIVLKSGYLLFTNLKNTLMQLYSVSERIVDAHKLFDEFHERNDLVSLNTLMGGYLQASKPEIVLDLFRQVGLRKLGVSTSAMLNILYAIGDLGDLYVGESLHAHYIKIGLCSKLNVVTALVNMYAKLGDIDSCCRIFDEASEKDVILWNCMIDKYAKCGMVEESVALLRLMKLKQVKANSSTLVGLLSACSASGHLSLGQYINDYVKEENLPLDTNLGTALVDMYAKCGLLNKAIDIFQRMESKDVKAWTAMVLGYGVHGQARNAIELFYRMEDDGCRPNEVTFLAVLNACSHGGQVEEGMKLFENMVLEHGFSPRTEHYGCLIDLLGRAGLLEEAYNLIRSLPIKYDATAWRCLLSACRVYGNVKLGESVKNILEEMNDEHPSDSILVSSAYAMAGRLADETRLQEMRREKINKEVGNELFGKKEKMVKEVGLSSYEMDGG